MMVVMVESDEIRSGYGWVPFDLSSLHLLISMDHSNDKGMSSISEEEAVPVPATELHQWAAMWKEM